VARPPDDAVQAYPDRIGFPGEPPFTRGIHATMYRGRTWTMRQYAGFGTAEESNRRFKFLLAEGTDGLSVAFDLPTQMGYDSDSPRAKGEVGKVGVAVSSIDDIARLFDGISLDRVSTSMTINATAAILLALYVGLAERTGVPRPALRGTVQNDILKEYIARSTYIYPPGPSMRLALDVVAFCAREIPKWNAISVSGYHIREAGSTAVQELAFTLGDAIAYLEAAAHRGMDVGRIAPQIAFFFNAQMDLLEEVAKFRAARRMWARIMKERFHVSSPEALRLRFHAQTAGVALTAQQPENNAVRVAIQALAAVLGGAQSLHTNSMDEALSLPSERAVRLALRTQQLLANESGVANTVDPVGGAHAVEALTDRLEADAWGLLEAVERKGGMMKAIESGWVQHEIAESAYRFQVELERGERLVVGVNAFADGTSPARSSRPGPGVAGQHLARLRAFRRARDPAKVRAILRRVAAVASSDANLVPPILDAVKARATLGEVSDALREVFGEYRPRDVS
jgi:methylmalonyl-CoA mutase N-terminal domain/subunit